MMSSSSSSATNSSLSSFSDECEATLPEPPPPSSSSSIQTTSNDRASEKKLVHKVEPVFNDDKNQMRIFLEDGSLAEYTIGDLTTAEELVEEMSSRHSLGADMRRYRLTLSETHDVSWRSIRYIRPQQKLKEVSQWSCITATKTICTLRVVIVPSQVEILADTEPITFTYLYRQSINDYVRERAGSEISAEIAVQLTALLILDESLCTGVRSSTLVKRSWLLRQLFPRSLLDQFSLKQLINRVRSHLEEKSPDLSQLTVAKQFLRIFSENTRSFGGKLFPVKFPDKHRDSILLVGPRNLIAILDQARRIHSPVIALVSSWSHLSRVIVKQYRNGVAIRLLTSPQTSTTTAATHDSSLLQQEIAFLIHTNLLNDLMAFIEGYSQLESSNCPLSIERISHSSKSPSFPSGKSRTTDSLNDTQFDSTHRSPLVQRILSNRKNHRTYTVSPEKQTPPASPSLFELTRQFFTRNPPKTIDIDERETLSNVPNRTTLVTWRSIADSQTSTPPSPQPPPPVLYRTVINVEHTEQMTSASDQDDEPDIIDLTTSYGYYGSLSFPIRPPSPFADGLVWSQMSNQHDDNDNTDGIVVWSPSTKQLSVHYNTNNNNSNDVLPPSPASSRASSSWRRTLDRILKRKKSKKASSETRTTHSPDYDIGEEDLSTTPTFSKHVHWIDDDEQEAIVNACHRFVEHLKLFVQQILNDNQKEIYFHNCQRSLDELHALKDCTELKQAFYHTAELARKCEKHQLLQQQTVIAHLISRTVLSS